ncbi:T-complex protein 1 subunit gamma-like protein [Drosera capensis]
MERGGLDERLAGLNARDENERSGLNQVIKVIEDAESTIKKQKSDRSTVSMVDRQGTLAFHDSNAINRDPARLHNGDGRSVINRNNEIHNSLSVGQTNGDNPATHPPPSYAAVSPERYPMDGIYDPQLNHYAQRLLAESSNSTNISKQDLIQKVKDQKEEIMLLRKQLTDYSIKESQLRNEKYLLEKRIANMRTAFDKQQQELADASVKALAYRQDVIEENVRLSYQLQDAQQERNTFVSSLLPVLVDYSLQPRVPDSLSIVANIKLLYAVICQPVVKGYRMYLFKHLQEKLSITEAKVKESQYQLIPVGVDVSSPQFAPSPQPSSSVLYSRKNGLEIVSQPVYTPGNVAAESPMATDWDVRGNYAYQNNVSGDAENMERDAMGRYSPIANRGSGFHDGSSQMAVTQKGMHVPQYHGETADRKPKFQDPVSSAMFEADSNTQYSERDPPVNWGPGISPYANTPAETSSYSPYLQPVPEERSSSFSEVADDDPLPSIKDLQISGEAYPGRELMATGHSINGTTCCNFEWLRHLEDGSFHYIEGAKAPRYLVTADDVGTSLSLEIQPLDDRKRQGELVRFFVNEHRKITCDPEMQSAIDRNLLDGQASYALYLSVGSPEKWVPANLTIKREGYIITSMESRDVISEKFLPLPTVSITTGLPLIFYIVHANGTEHILQVEDVPDISGFVREVIFFYLLQFKRLNRPHLAGVHKQGFSSKTQTQSRANHVTETTLPGFESPFPGFSSIIGINQRIFPPPPRCAIAIAAAAPLLSSPLLSSPSSSPSSHHHAAASSSPEVCSVQFSSVVFDVGIPRCRLQDNSTKRESGSRVHYAVIQAAKAVADIIRTTLGPRSMLKMLLDAAGGIVVTNDGNAILRELDLAHPAAKSMIELSRTQDEEVGDGTTSVIVLAGEMLHVAEAFIDKKYHPTVITRAYNKALEDAIAVLDKIAMTIDVNDRATMLGLVKSCIGTKFTSQFGDLIADLAIDSTSMVGVDLGQGLREVDIKKYIKVEKLPGGQLEDSRVLRGVMINKDVVAPSKMRRKIVNPRIILLDSPLEYKKGENQTNAEIVREEDWEVLLRMEEEYIENLCAQILKFKPDLVITEKGLSDLACHYLSKAGVSAIRRVRKTDNNRIAKACGAVIVNRPDELQESDVGTGAGLFEVKKFGDEFFAFIVDCKEPKACTVLLRGASKDLLNEVERNLQDAMCVARNIIKNPKLLPGGGATELTVSATLKQKSSSIEGIEKWPYEAAALAFEAIPRTLAQNCGVNVIRTMTALQGKHANGENAWVGIDGNTGVIADMKEKRIWDSYTVKAQTFKTAMEAACMLLRIDDIVSGIKKKQAPGAASQKPKVEQAEDADNEQILPE